MAATREQRIVRELTETIPTEAARLKPVTSRARSLPAMLRRHGPVQTLMFLAAKAARLNDSEAAAGRLHDGSLAEWLVQGTQSALNQASATVPTDYATSLASMALPRYLLHWEAAIESATWLKRIVEARTKAGTPNGQDADASDDGAANDSHPEEPTS